ncbi:DNA-3-methyladenine glycosylase I [Reichenbachiella carrageenanivorans]|uniref:DNA-3-methyladenine glycosylase I n=1 Tax=Reichenbachiella carrageenanivorans TaxID=2979869 RepID=A0ABY6D4L4_9BACT|nr:DNA-3-methyladenine glycosylase I [Reichenbachiella carrageenanivorans]UXX80565.1 DNA-3-methyladenine glycosylase I [Reichenbachiella carrageenanivorans]
MNKHKCEWALGHFDAYENYHDQEWGVPCHDDKIHFEFLILESAQAGLSWSTVLKKRAGYQLAFANFEVNQVAQFDESQIATLMINPAIIRNEQKIRAAVNNAQRFLEVQQEFSSFSKYIWSFVGDQPIVGHWATKQDVPATTAESDALSKDLKKRGFKFVGSTTIYAHMQATGLVNDHTTDCYRYQELLR